MPWTKTTREQYRRDGLRYASDMSYAEWLLLKLSAAAAAADGPSLRWICV